VQGTTSFSRCRLFPGAKLAGDGGRLLKSSLEGAALVNKWSFVSFGARTEDDVTRTLQHSHELAQLNQLCRMHLSRNGSDHVLVFVLKTSTF